MMNLRFLILGSFAGLTLLPGCRPIESGNPSARQSANKAEPHSKQVRVSFTESIRPILSNHCTICHNSEVLPTRPNFETREGAMKSGMIVPGNPDASRILSLIKEDPAAEKAIPPVNHRLTNDQITLLKTWIEEGADWPGGEAGRVKPAFIPRE